MYVCIHLLMYLSAFANYICLAEHMLCYICMRLYIFISIQSADRLTELCDPRFEARLHMVGSCACTQSRRMTTPPSSLRTMTTANLLACRWQLARVVLLMAKQLQLYAGLFANILQLLDAAHSARPLNPQPADASP